MDTDLETRAATVAARIFGVAGHARRLDGERDLNFRITTDTGDSFVLKLHHPDSNPDELDLQNCVLVHLASAVLPLSTPRVVPSVVGELTAETPWEDGVRKARLLTWLPGRPWPIASPVPEMLEDLGRNIAHLDHALSDFRHPADDRPGLEWRITAAGQVAAFAGDVDGEVRTLVSTVLAHFVADVAPRLRELPHQVVHHDANEHNIVVDQTTDKVTGLIDFGDVARVPRVAELAVACAYAAQGHSDPVDAIFPLVRGYDSVVPLTPGELAVLLDLVKVRLAMSITMSARQLKADPTNTYLGVSQEGVRSVLQLLDRLDRDLFHFRLRDQVGFEANPVARDIRRHFESGAAAITPLVADGARTGGSREYRYGSGTASSTQTVRLSRALEVTTGSAVHCPLDATVETVGDDWVVLQHRTLAGIPFWTALRGLDMSGHSQTRVGATLSRGTELGVCRGSDSSGTSLLDVQLCTFRSTIAHEPPRCPPEDFDVWRSLCPDPNLLVGDPDPASERPERGAEQLVRRRRTNFSRAMSISYTQPLHIVRGRGAHLFDRQGNRFLDLVNNVCHVGHSHPRVVEAAHRQAAALNTNMRYLHESVVEYSHRLLELLPDPLRVCFLVNSGSEANDLALRLARAHTGARDTLVLDHAYHGNLTSQVDLSPYKFNRAGGQGRPDMTWVCQLPDSYRGPHRDLPEREQAHRYARSVGEQLEGVAATGRRPAAFFVESLQSCGGQIVLPQGYLAETFALVRESGAVTVADEVQVGLGRVGAHTWGFELQGVVPDIVTMGKPLGNGHPLAAVVTTPEIARSFETGMEWFNTFGGNPVSAEVGNAVLDVLRDEKLQANAARVGQRLKSGLSEIADRHDLVGDVRGEGLFVGVELSLDNRAPATAQAGRLKEAIKARGALVSTDGPDDNVIKLKPPMVLSESDCDEFLSIFEESLADVAAGPI